MIRFLRILVGLTAGLLPLAAGAQESAWDAMRDITPRKYIAPRLAEPVVVDGCVDEAAWEAAPWTEPFVDIRGDDHPAPPYETRARIGWDDRYLYVAARLIEPHIWGTLTEKNSIIYRDNDFEIFIDPDGDRHDYYEFEINALNTIMELTMNRPYADGGSYELGTNITGLRSAVCYEGTLNAPHDEDDAWSIEVAIPWDGLGRYAPEGVPPEGQTWRMNFSRVHWPFEIDGNVYRKTADAHEDNWVWSPIGIVDMHRPERWAEVFFASDSGAQDNVFDEAGAAAREVLMELYYRQQARIAAGQPAATSIDEAGFPPDDARLRGHHPLFDAGESGAFTISVDIADSADGARRFTVDQFGRLHATSRP